MAKIKIKKPAITFSIASLILGGVLGFSTFNQDNPVDSVEEQRAELFLMPEKGTFIVDEDFQIAVNVSVNKEINAASGEMRFPVDKLEVVGISKDESIFELWVVEPSYSNTDGAIWFSGGLPTPGFNGSEGKILTIVFKPKKQGKADISIKQGLVLANDGKGTDILKELKGSSFDLMSPISSDLNKDGFVGLYDLSILLSNWGIPENPRADINQDGKVDIADFSILLFNLTQ